MFIAESRLRDMVNLEHTFLFADLCGYSEYSWIHGDDCSVTVAIDFHDSVRHLANESGCEFVKTIGDAVMVRADDPRDAVRLAERIRRSVQSDGRLDVRIGLDTGSALECRGDWYGTTVNTAARVTRLAGPGELMMTDRVREAIRDSATVDPLSRGRCALKGLPDCDLHALEPLRVQVRGSQASGLASP